MSGASSAPGAGRNWERTLSKNVVIGGVVALAVVAGGGFGGYQFLLAEQPGGTEAEATETTEAAESSETAKAALDAAPVYIALQPFSAPIMRNSRVRYYVQFSVSLQLDAEPSKEKVYQQMPRLRDAILRDLHSHSVLRDGSRRAINFEAVKSRLLAQARAVLGAEVVVDVLVTRALGG